MDKILQQTGLQIVNLVQQHYDDISSSRKQKAMDIKEKMKNIATTSQNVPEMKALVSKMAGEAQTVAKEKALELKEKRKRSKRNLENTACTAYALGVEKNNDISKRIISQAISMMLLER